MSVLLSTEALDGFKNSKHVLEVYFYISNTLLSEQQRLFRTETKVHVPIMLRAVPTIVEPIVCLATTRMRSGPRYTRTGLGMAEKDHCNGFYRCVVV